MTNETIGHFINGQNVRRISQSGENTSPSWGPYRSQ